MHGDFLKETLIRAGINTDNLIQDEKYFTTLAFVSLKENGEREFAFARKPGADTNLCMKEIDPEILENTRVFHVGSLSRCSFARRRDSPVMLKIWRSGRSKSRTTILMEILIRTPIRMVVR